MSDDATTPPEPSDGSSSEVPLVDQAELDALLAQFSASKAKSPAADAPTASAADASEADEDAGGPASQDEIDRLLKAGDDAEQPAPAEAAPAASEDDGGTVGQDEIDRLLKAGGDAEEPAPAEAAPAASDDDGGTVSQDEIDRLLKAGGDAEQPAPAEAAPAASEDDGGTVSQDEIDRLLKAGGDAEQPAPAKAAPAASEDDGGSVSQDEIDRLLAGAGADQPLDDRSPESVLPSGDGDGMDAVLAGDEAVDKPVAVSQDDIDSIIGAAEGPADTAEDPIARLAREEAEGTVGSENLAAAAEASADGSGEDDGLVSQEMLDALLAGAQEGGADEGDSEQLDEMLDVAASGAEAQAGAAPDKVVVPSEDELTDELTGMGLEEAPASAGPPDVGGAEDFAEERGARSRVPQLQSQVLTYLGVLAGPRGPKVLAAACMGILAATAAFALLYVNRERRVDLGAVPPARATDLQREIRAARNLVDVGKYTGAVSKLEDILKKAPHGPDRGEAAYLRAKASYMGLPERVSALGAEDAHIAMDDFLREAPSHANVPEVLHWKALVYERTDLAQGARDVYTEIVRTYGAAPNLDDVLLDAARVAMTLNRPQEAVDHLEQFMSRYPGSPKAGTARLALGEALVASGKRAEGEAILMRVARSQPNTKLGAEAYARLGRIAFDEGAYADAIRLLEARLTTATTIEGNEQVYLILAKAYRASNQLADAERVIRELLDFFPESSVTAEAYVELSQVLDARGQRRDALRVASQGALDAPGNAAVLRNKADLLVRSGDKRAAAEALMDADSQGANDPEALLMAGRLYREMEDPIEAQAALERLIVDFPRTPEAFEGSIELARVFLDRGRVRRALNRLRDLAEMSAGRPQRLPVLVALAETYKELGLTVEAAGTYGEVAGLTTEPEVLATAAVAMLDAEQWSDGLALAERVDLSRVRDAKAYEFLMKHAEALLRTDSARAVSEMERAYESYPKARTPEGDLALLEAYLATDRNARARILVRDIEDQVRRSPGDAGHLEKAAGLWGDYLFDRRDYRTAAEAYTLAAGKLGSSSVDAAWARYMHANALLQLQSFEDSIKIYDAIADSDSPWADDASAKAGYARMEQRLRGLEPTPLPTEG
ncbi:MAG: tetratricopeptide repeat protein [bacterium]|nr:tetratricopeptide repeat protein [bacterium]